MLATLAVLGVTTGEAGEVARATHHYLANRRAMIRYAAFVQAGYPIGSGCVERANKTVVEARLKGAGMHWYRDHVTPMLELRTMLRTGRWAERWPTLWDRLRTRHQRPRRPIVPAPAPRACPPTPAEPAPSRPPTIVNGKPTADHPWRKSSPFPAKL